MYRLIYVSSAVELFSDQGLVELLNQSRRNNEELGLTGMLLYKDGNFMQFLEGNHLAVLEVMERIKADPRHRGLIVLVEEEVPEREFSEWSMGFKKLDSTSADLPGYSDFFDLPLTSEKFLENPSKSLRLLLNFKKMIR